MLLVRDSHPADAKAEMAFSAALLRDVATGQREACARLYRPGATLAFGRRDALLPGFADACAAALAHGFAPVVRLGGGHAAAYDAGAVVVEVVAGQAQVGVGIEARFAWLADALIEGLADVGVTAVAGELAGEYCPGRWSLHASGSGVKLAGIAQRSVRGAALTTAFVAVQGGARLRAVLVDVYDALGLQWSPATAGALEDVQPGVTADDVQTALAAVLSRR
jgi:octanoyl-[GcvH]:protein N-octanoyltransferase